MKVAVGIAAYNEGANLAALLARLRSLTPAATGIERIVVVASGCTDDTASAAMQAARDDPRVEVIVDPVRRGKAAAINQFLSACRSAEIVVMESADTLPAAGAIELMLTHFSDPRVGMVGSRPIPEDDPATFPGYLAQLQWRLHDAVASRSPKQGELVAWRNVVDALPVEAAVMDEAYLEAALTKVGYRLVYERRAIVHNHGPATLAAFIAQRRRNHAGHRVLAAAEGYRPATRDHLLLVRLALEELLDQPRASPWLLAAIAIEIWCALLGWWDFAVAHRDHRTWKVIEGTKELAAAAEITPLVVAVILSYDGHAYVSEAVASVLRNRYARLRVLVVDNGSTDGTGELVRRAFPGVEVLRIERNEGVVSGMNAGIERALAMGADHILYLNDDVVVADDFIELVVEVARSDPRIATVTGPIFYQADPERLWYAGGGIAWWIGKTYHRGRRAPWGPEFATARDIDYATGTAELIRAASLRDIGLWDTRYFGTFEDTDWCVRASRRGWRHRYDPAPRAWHRVSATWGGEKAPPYLYYLFRNNILFMRVRGRPWHWPGFAVFFALESVVRYAVTGLFSRTRRRVLAAIGMALCDALRGRYGRGSGELAAITGRPKAD